MSNKERGEKSHFPHSKLKYCAIPLKFKFILLIPQVWIYTTIKTDTPASFQTVSTCANQSIFDLFLFSSVIFLNLKCMIWLQICGLWPILRIVKLQNHTAGQFSSNCFNWKNQEPQDLCSLPKTTPRSKNLV